MVWFLLLQEVYQRPSHKKSAEKTWHLRPVLVYLVCWGWWVSEVPLSTLESLREIGLVYHISWWTQIPHNMMNSLKKRLDNDMRMWDNVYVRWERGDRASQKDQWRSEAQKARSNETVIFHGPGSVRQLESGYDWTRAQKKRKKRLDICF